MFAYLYYLHEENESKMQGMDKEQLSYATQQNNTYNKNINTIHIL